MNLAEYTAQTHLTAKYPGSGLKIGLQYVSLGMIGEVGEVAEHIKKMMRDDESTMTDARREKLIMEIGDVLWYWSEARRCLGMDPPSRHPNVASGRFDITKIVTSLAVQAAAFASAGMDGPRKTSLALLLEFLLMLCQKLDVSIEHVAEQNALKLQRRLTEGKISGSGSDR